MSTRESRRLKEKRSIIPFGDIMLPVIGLVAVGLLIVGVKLFFLSGPKAPSYSPVSQQLPAARQEAPPKAEAVPAEQVGSRPAQQTIPVKEGPVLAAPVGGQTAAASPGRAQPNENATARPVKQTAPARKPEPAAPQKPAPPARRTTAFSGSSPSRNTSSTVGILTVNCQPRDASSSLLLGLPEARTRFTGQPIFPRSPLLSCRDCT
jgi:hypothetical protein